MTLAKLAPANPAYETLVAKLHPNRFTGMSGKMAAIVGAVVGKEYTTPAITTGFAITSDGFVQAGHAFLGSAGDFEDNWRRLLDVAELDQDERALFDGLYAAAVADWRTGFPGRGVL